MAIKVFVAGDVVPRDRTVPLFKEKKIKEIWGEDMMSIINKSEIKIVNLEAPVINGSPSPIAKSGPALYTGIETVEALKDLGFNVITLANNHFRDQGEKGVYDTIKAIETLNLKYVGGGYNYSGARKILYYRQENQCIAIINVCEHEFSIATDEYGGANPMDLISLYNDINESRKKADFVIVITHGGVEHYQLPTPRMKKEYRYYIDAGADVVINHHQHCFSGYERYKDKLIFYGLGNFCFDWNGKRHSLWNKGYAITLLLDKKIDFTIHPYIQCDDLPTVICKNEDFYDKDIAILNRIIADDKELYNNFRRYALSCDRDFLFRLSSFENRFLRALYRRNFLKEIYSSSKLLIVKNLISCEAHRDVLMEILCNKIKQCQGKV